MSAVPVERGSRRATAVASGRDESGGEALNARRIRRGATADSRGASRGEGLNIGAVPVQAGVPGSDLERGPADQELVDALAACGFSGPRYDRFRDELARYGISVLCGWMRSGYVFYLTAKRGIPLRPAEEELGELHSDPDVCQELAMTTVAVALGRFRQHALVEGGWRADGGASLTTYFLGACLSAFPNEFRKHRLHKQKWQNLDAADPELMACWLDDRPGPDDVTLGNMHVRDALARAGPRTRTIVALWLDGYHQEEIAEMIGEKSARAVEGVLYRWRVKEIRRVREGGD